MLEYRISAAQFLSAAIIGVCFVIAVIVITLRAERRNRAFGVLGVVLVVASPIAATINGSLGAVYGTGATVYAVGSVLVAVFAAAGLVLLALAVGGGRTARPPVGGR